MSGLHDKGFFDLQTPADLLGKLGRELERMQSAPRDIDHAFNFFVTAEHMLDWLYPGKANDTKRSEARKLPLLALVSHIANGSKHFMAEAKRHKSMTWTVEVHRHEVQLCIVVTFDTGLSYGSERMIRPVGDIARLVFEHWRGELSKGATAMASAPP